MDSHSLRVAIAEDHPVIRLGIEAEIDKAAGMQSVGLAGNADELIALLHRQPVDVAVTDYAMPGGTQRDGVVLLDYLAVHFPDVAVVVITAMTTPVLIRNLQVHGVNSVVSKGDALTHLLPAIHAAFTRRRYRSPRMAAAVAHFTHDDMFGKLSLREKEVLSLFVAGSGIGEIADKLKRSKQTVSTQKINAMNKLGIDRDLDLFVYAAEAGLLRQRTPD
jgi:two-component system capsular synthesis response regulator RcsB